MTFDALPMPGDELGEAALLVAFGWERAKLHEVGGNNRGEQIDKIQAIWGLSGQPWCAMFCLYCYLKAIAEHQGAPQTVATWKGLLSAFRRWYFDPSPSCTAIMESAKRQGIWVPWQNGEGAEPGDLILFDFNGNRQNAEHVGFFVRAIDGMATTVEGNTSPGDGGSQANGGGVFERRRKASVILGTVAIHRVK